MEVPERIKGEDKMKKRKTKSRLTKVDLDAVLKLQREHAELEQRTHRLLEWVMELNKGHIALFICGDDIIDAIAGKVLEIAEELNVLSATLIEIPKPLSDDIIPKGLRQALNEAYINYIKQQYNEATDTIPSKDAQ